VADRGTASEAVVGCSPPLEVWEGRAVETLKAEWSVPDLMVCQRVGSTNDVARDLALSGCASATCVIAEEQTAGRGRHARPWESPPGLGLWLSIVVRPPAGADPGVVPLLTGLAVARAVEPFCGNLEPTIKWPNDVLVDGRKLAGILCEATWKADRLAFMVVGVGLNVLHAAHDFAPELRGFATSLRIVGGGSPSRVAVAGAVVRSVIRSVRFPAFDADALAELRRRDPLAGRRIVVHRGDGAHLVGTAQGIAEDGCLVLRTDHGSTLRVRTGTVRLAPTDELAEHRHGQRPADSRDATG